MIWCNWYYQLRGGGLKSLISTIKLSATCNVSKSDFGMQKDPNQMSATKENRDWVYKNAPDYLNLTRNNGRIIITKDTKKL